jgi:outer membrane protein OmpA-like peptidoglycan-associated protein
VSPTGSFGFGITPPLAKDLDQGIFDAFAGWTFRLGEKMGLRLEARNMLWIPAKKKNGSTQVDISSAKVNYQVYGAALEFRFGGKPKDTDGDGVPDKNDKCPGTTVGCKVDATGCPIDSDGDGVCDGLDKCPGTPKGATVDATGCPKDTDGDGVYDGLDNCPDTPKGATVDAHGCPTDSDGDGVYDGLDKCPDTPKGAIVDASGCPKDSDGDGVPDGLDKCPDTPAGAKVDASGCPIEVMERETELLDTGMIRLNNINFETGKAVLLPEDFPTLDVVGQVLTKWPELKIEVGGHTDSRGSVALNQKLSETRAQSVLTYLEKHFPDLHPDQFTVKGYGKSKPLVPNNSALNMAKNRRVEFVVLNKTVLKRESEKRKLLQK